VTRLYLQDSIESGSLLIKSDSRLSDSSLSNTKDSVLNVVVFVASKCKHIKQHCYYWKYNLLC